ncbi:MAG: transposase [Halanaerobiales bacterium]|nr:transposase [Halanaerobiales bacterium]
MNTQLDLFSPLYYSTLGYDLELISYNTFIEDEFVRKIFPEPISGTRGRKSYDPVVLFRMLFLYFTRPEFTSFRQMCRELRKPKHQDYRNFLGIYSFNIPSHSTLSKFRKQLGIDDNLLNELNKEVVHQAKNMDGFLNLMIGSLDSRPIFANVGGFKKECVCNNPDNCTCKLRFSDTDTAIGRQRIKVNQNRYFIGYRKTTVICPSSQGPMPLVSNVVNAKVSDHDMLIPALERLKEMDISIPYVIGDMGYIKGDNKIKALKDYSIAVTTQVKNNMLTPETCNEHGQVLCPEGHVAQYLGFNMDTLQVIYGGNLDHCSSCIRNQTCSREIMLSFEESPQFFGPVPQNSILQKGMLKFRKQSELNFALESNMLDKVFRHNKIPVRGQKNVETYLRLADLFRLILGMVHHAIEHFISKDQKKQIRNLANKAILDWNFSTSQVA